MEKRQWYLKLRYSRFHELNLSIRHPLQYQSIQRENQLYITLLQLQQVKNPIIFDVGANIGQLTLAFLAVEPKIIVAIEPDFRNFRILKIRLHNCENVKLIEKAASNKISQLPLHRHENGGTLSTLNIKWKNFLNSGSQGAFSGKFDFADTPTVVKTITLDHLIEKYGVPDLIKIDVEGHELEVLEGLSHIVPLLAFEANLPAFLMETKQIVQRLYNLSPNYLFNVSENAASLHFNEFQALNQIQEYLDSCLHNGVTIFAKLYQ